MSLREQLSRKTRRRTHYDLVLDDADDAQAALDAATGELRLAKLRHDQADAPEVVAAQQAFDAARTELLTHVCRITFEGIPLHEWDEMRSAPEHAPSAQQLADHAVEVERAKRNGDTPPGPPDFNPVTLIPELFARCAVPDDDEAPLTAEEWTQQLAPGGLWQEAERAAAFNACLSAILTPRSLSIPKG